MVEQISAKFFNTTPTAPKTFTNSAVACTEDKSENKTDIKKLLFPFSLITGGGILLYYGIKAPTKSGIIKNIVKENKEKMQLQFRNYISDVDRMLNISYGGIKTRLADYVRRNTVDPASADIIVNYKEPEKVIRALNFAFAKIENSGTDHIQKEGVPEFRQLFFDVEKTRDAVNESLSGKQKSIGLLFNDYSRLPNSSDAKYEKLLTSCRGELQDLSLSLLSRMLVYKYLHNKNVTEQYYKQISEAVTAVRNSRTNAKKSIIDAAYDNIRTLLGLGGDFTCGYSKITPFKNFDSLTEKELKPITDIPHELKSLHTGNIYFDTAVSKDFNKFDEKELKRIFYSTHYDNNLFDLRILIDRLILSQKVIEHTSKDSAGVYSNIIAKLEFLSNKLNDFGNKELIKKCSVDFGRMEQETRHAALYYINTVSRRLGYNTLEQMDKAMSGNPAYKNLDIRHFMEIFKNNPREYFF